MLGNFFFSLQKYGACVLQIAVRFIVITIHQCSLAMAVWSECQTADLGEAQCKNQQLFVQIILHPLLQVLSNRFLNFKLRVKYQQSLATQIVQNWVTYWQTLWISIALINCLENLSLCLCVDFQHWGRFPCPTPLPLSVPPPSQPHSPHLPALSPHSLTANSVRRKGGLTHTFTAMQPHHQSSSPWQPLTARKPL